ncbi:tetratricopeptide repeat protein [Sedimenticola sp.]|uniref:tetratricopeptide repeat protein n=2 Tax=Sedimenticola sp. TaxID=1940285 RepID=UPI003D0961B3
MYKDGDYKLGKAFEALGGMLQVGQRHEEAIQNFKAALKIFLAQTPSSKTQWKILSTRTSIGKSLYSLGKYKEAAVVLEDSLHGHLDPNGKHYAYVETMLEYLAWAYHKAGVHEEALKYCKIYLDNVRELGREDDHFSTPVRFLYGESLNSLGRHQQAITQYEKVLAFYRRWIPEDHPNIAQVKGRLMAAQKAFSNHEKGN